MKYEFKKRVVSKKHEFFGRLNVTLVIKGHCQLNLCKASKGKNKEIKDFLLASSQVSTVNNVFSKCRKVQSPSKSD